MKWLRYRSGLRWPIPKTHNGAIAAIFFAGREAIKAFLTRKKEKELMTSWFEGQAPQLRDGNEGLDHAVACGGAFYGGAKHYGGVRIHGGTARSYYLGI